jgi:Domain of unknown function (DUF4167)
LINNRQGGRRRGRGGQRGQSPGGQPGNRQDNRQRGNAAQLLEKYKSMARDAQLAGDRVQTEYYLQFADHYFRVLSESRARFEEQNPRRGRDDGDDDEGDDEMVEAGEGDTQTNDDRPERGNRQPRREREPRRFNRDDRASADSDDQPEAPHMNGGADGSIPLDVLPPAIGADEVGQLAADEEPAPRPRRRPRAARPTEEGDEEIAPAA